MSHDELGRVIQDIGGLTSQPPAIPPAKVLRRFQHRIAGLDAMADQLRANADAFEETEIEETLEALLAVADELRTMLPERRVALGLCRVRFAHARVEDPAVPADAGCIAVLGDDLVATAALERRIVTLRQGRT